MIAWISVDRYPFQLWTYPVWALVHFITSIVSLCTLGFWAPNWELGYLIWRYRFVRKQSEGDTK
jgi:hypothetical protein